MKNPHRMRAPGVIAAALALAATLAVPATADTAEPPQDWPEFGYQGVITDKSQMIYNETNEYIFPSIFHAGAHLDDPLGEWYMYLAPHDAPAGVMLMYADSLDGPWTEYGANPIIEREWDPYYDVSHISSPDAIWNDEAQQMYLYFHGENSTTRWATTTDGITFEYGGVAVNNAMASAITTESSYGRVFEHPNADGAYEYGMFYMANETDNRRKIRLAESVDGETWTVAPDYAVVPGAEEGANVSGANLWEWNDQLYVIYHASSGKTYARAIDETLREVAQTPILLHEASGIGDDVGRIAAPEIVTYGGETYMFYESGDRLGATIAWAKEGADVVIPQPFGGFPEDADNPVFAQCAAPGSDEFEGDALAAGVWDRVVREDLARHEVADGALSIPTYAGGVSAAPLLQQELPEGAWQVTTKVDLDPAQRYQQAGLLLYASDTHYAKLDMGVATPGRTVELVYHRDGSNRQDSAAPDEYQSEIWLRYTSDGDTIRASVSYDGATFARYGREIVVADAGFTHVGPYAFRGGESTPEIEATFDWFRLSPDAESYEQCMTSTQPPGAHFPEDSDNPVFAQCAAPGSDEFEGNALAAGVWDRVVREDLARHEVADGALTIPTYAGGVAAAPLLQQELPEGPWQVTAKVDVDPAQRYQQAGLLLYSTDTHYAKLDMVEAAGGRSVELVYHRDGGNRLDTGAPQQTQSEIWLRYTSDGEAIRASVSYDGVTFARYGRDISVADAGFTHVGPFAFRGGESTPEIEATFDWFRFSPDAEAYQECLDASAIPDDDETSVPAQGSLTSTSGWSHGLHDGNFDVRWDMWWGPNASRVVLFENGEQIAVQDLAAGGPSAQHVAFPVTGRPNGEYEYVAELTNSVGTTSTQTVTVSVTDAAPGTPVLSHNNWDGDGEYRVVANMWWGTNATSWELFEDGVAIAAGQLESASPAAQRVEVPVTGRSAGTREYLITFTNAAGSTDSASIEIGVNG